MKRTTEKAKAYFASQGCELLDEYSGCLIKMKYRCRCGRIDFKSWNKFHDRGHKCGYCHETGRKKRYTFEEVKEEFEKRGCKLLSPNYINQTLPLDYICKCGRASKISFGAFLHQNQTCYQCGLEKNKKEKHHYWIKDRESKKLNAKLRKKCYKMLSTTLSETKKHKTSKTYKMLGYSLDELRSHLTNHPNWERCKDTDWHVDHIFPVAAFIAHGITDPALINCLDNLQPLPQKENNEKWAHYDKDKFLEFVANHTK